MRDVVHHIELWTSDVEAVAPSFDWLSAILGWTPSHDLARPTGRIRQHPNGVHPVLEQSLNISGPLERVHADLNHLVLRAIELMVG